ncbi:MAG: hypothetical protein ACYCZX_12175 [Rhodospirillaceae bacterium]
MDDIDLFTTFARSSAGLSGGAAALVNTDLNEETANQLSAQTRQQLATIPRALAQGCE